MDLVELREKLAAPDLLDPLDSLDLLVLLALLDLLVAVEKTDPMV